MDTSRQTPALLPVERGKRNAKGPSRSEPQPVGVSETRQSRAGRASPLAPLPTPPFDQSGYKG